VNAWNSRAFPRKGQSITSKFQNNVLTKPYEIAAKLGLCPDIAGAFRRATTGDSMTVVEPRAKVQREERRQLHKRLAWITVGDGVAEHECHVLDVSSGGARIAMDDPMDVRDRFELTLVRGHHKRELCEVVWRRGKTYGVKFLTLLPEVTPPVSDPAEASIQPS
jgi:PilZ domain-containing protein